MIAIVNTGGANISSVVNAMNRLNIAADLTQDPDKIYQASKVIFPGVGAAKASMDKIKKAELVSVMRELKQPTLGICLGMQLLFERSDEGDTDCLGIIPGTVSKIPDTEGLSLPHMGWNRLIFDKPSPLLKGLEEGVYAYFVHSFQGPINAHTVASVEYGVKIPALVQRDNFFGAQFHPEKSAKNGEQILRNFIEL